MAISLQDSMIKLLDRNVGDLTITPTDGAGIKVIRAIVENVTPYFSAVNHGRHPSEISAKVNSACLRYVIEYIYTLHVSSIMSFAMVDQFKILDLARMWMLDELRDKVRAAIISQTTNTTMFEIFDLSERYEVDEARQYSAKMIAIMIRGTECYDLTSSETYRYCCKHTYKIKHTGHSSYCFYNYSSSKVVAGNTNYCCLHKNGGHPAGMISAEWIDRMSAKQVKYILKMMLE